MKGGKNLKRGGNNLIRAGSPAPVGTGRNRARTRVARALDSYGSVAEARAIGRSLSLLPDNVQDLVDSRVVAVSGERLNIIKRFLAAGLVYDLPNWWSVATVSRYALGDAGRARVSMNPKGRGERFRRDRKRYTLPIPCIWTDFSFQRRELAMAARTGVPLETAHIDQAIRNCDETAEDMFFYGGPAVHGNPIPGLLSTTSLYTLTGNTAWTAQTGENILKDVNNMLEVQRLNGFRGPQELIVPGNYNTRLGEDYKATGDKTTLQRIKELVTADGQPINITVSDRLPANTVLMVQMTSDVVDMVYGQGPTSFSWTDGPGLETFWFVVACIVPRVFPNYLGKYGIVKGAP